MGIAKFSLFVLCGFLLLMFLGASVLWPAAQGLILIIPSSAAIFACADLRWRIRRLLIPFGIGLAGWLLIDGIGALLGFWGSYALLAACYFDPVRYLRNRSEVPTTARVLDKQNHLSMVSPEFMGAWFFMAISLPWLLSFLHGWQVIDLDRWRPVAEILGPYWPAIGFLDSLHNNTGAVDHAMRPPAHSGAIIVLCVMVTLMSAFSVMAMQRHLARLAPFFYLRQRMHIRTAGGALFMPPLVAAFAMSCLAVFLFWVIHQAGGWIPDERRKVTTIFWGMILLLPFWSILTAATLSLQQILLWRRYEGKLDRFKRDFLESCRFYGLAAPTTAEWQQIADLVDGPAVINPYHDYYRLAGPVRTMPSSAMLVSLGFAAIAAPLFASLTMPWVQAFAMIQLAACLGFILYRVLCARIWESLAGWIAGMLLLGELGAFMGAWAGYAFGECRRYDPAGMFSIGQGRAALVVRFDNALLVLPILTAWFLAILPEGLFVLTQWGAIDPSDLYPLQDYMRPILPALEAMSDLWRYSSVTSYSFVQYYELGPTVILLCLWTMVVALIAIFSHLFRHRAIYRLAYQIFNLPVFLNRHLAFSPAPIYVLAGIFIIYFGLAGGILDRADDAAFMRWGVYWELCFLIFLTIPFGLFHDSVKKRYLHCLDQFKQDIGMLRDRLLPASSSMDAVQGHNGPAI